MEGKNINILHYIYTNEKKIDISDIVIFVLQALVHYFLGLQYSRTEELNARVLWISFRLRRLQVVEISYSKYS